MSERLCQDPGGDAAADFRMRCGRLVREEPLAFYDVPTAYLEHLRRTNPSEGQYPTVARRTSTSQGPPVLRDGHRDYVPAALCATVWAAVSRRGPLMDQDELVRHSAGTL